jgi:hypothetical protein
MATQNVLLVDKDAADIQNRRMHVYLDEANRVDAYNSFKALHEATRALNICRGMFEALNGLGLIEAENIVKDDISRIESKIENIYEEKRSKHLPRWRSEV